MTTATQAADQPAAQPAVPPAVHPVDEKLPPLRLTALGLQHVLVMYAGAVAVPLIIGRALQLSPQQVAHLISADLFCCGLVTLIQSMGMTRWFGIKMPVMMGVTFAAVGPIVAFATMKPGPDGAREIFGTVIGAGALALLIAPAISKLLRFFPPVVTGTIIAIIGVSLMRVAVAWAMGGPAHLATVVDVPALANMIDAARLQYDSLLAQAVADGTAAPAMKLGGPIPTLPNPNYGSLDNMAIAAVVLVFILLLVKYMKGFIANISVLLGMVLGCVIATAMGKMTFEKVGHAVWFDFVTPFAFGMPTFDIVKILTMTLVMIVVMIESTGMFLALSDITEKPIGQKELAAGLRTDGLGTIIGGIFNTFPYTSFSQNVGLVGVTGVRSRFVCVAGGVVMIVLGLLPKLGALVESVPLFVLGGAGLVMFGMVAATGIRILSGVDFAKNRNNLFIVAVSLGMGMIPLIAPSFKQWIWHDIHPLIESGILLASIAAVALNAFFNGASGSLDEIKAAASKADH